MTRRTARKGATRGPRACLRSSATRRRAHSCPEFLMPPSGSTPLSTEVKWFVGVLAFLLATFVGGFLLFMQELAKL